MTAALPNFSTLVPELNFGYLKKINFKQFSNSNSLFKSKANYLESIKNNLTASLKISIFFFDFYFY